MTDAQNALTVPALTVRETTSEQVPPRPDEEKYRAYFASAGSLPAPPDADAGHYQKLVLDIRRGELYFHCEDWRVRRDPNGTDRFPDPAGHFAPFHWLTVPDVIHWTIDSGIPVAERPYLTLTEGNAFARELAPLAEALLLNLLPVPGTDTFDWSAEAASAGRDIEAACSRHREPPRGRRQELVNMHEAVAARPELVQTFWARLTDAELDQEAEYLNRQGLTNSPRLAERLGVDPEDTHASLVGTRAWLYEYRAAAAAGRPFQNAEEWLDRAEQAALNRARGKERTPGAPGAAQPVPYVTADTTDAELERSAERIAADAAAEGTVLLGDLKRAVTARRTQLRQQILNELATFGTARADAETIVRNSRAAIYARLYQAFSWEGHPETSDAELGRLAQMTRQAVNKLRERIDDEEE